MTYNYAEFLIIGSRRQKIPD